MENEGEKKGELNSDKVFISDYMKWRSYNKTLYGRLINIINRNCEKLFLENPKVRVIITLSAKYQTPRLLIMNGDYEGVPDKIEDFESQITDALNEVGFEYGESIEKQDYYIIEFTD